MNQLGYLFEDIQRLVGSNPFRYLYFWLTRSFWGIFAYRLDRMGYLIFKKAWSMVRLIFLPFIYGIEAYSNIDIHYQADIQGGMIVLHPSGGVVISGHCRIGKRLTLTGGNIIGCESNERGDPVRIGDRCNLGANATIIGPLSLGHHIRIGACACVVKDCLEDYQVLGGVPAKIIGQAKE